MATLTEVKIKKLREFRAGILDPKKAELTPKLISSYWESNRDKLRQPWQSVQKSRILHKTIEVDFKGHILCTNDVRKWRRKWRTWVTSGYRQTGSR